MKTSDSSATPAEPFSPESSEKPQFPPRWRRASISSIRRRARTPSFRRKPESIFSGLQDSRMRGRARLWLPVQPADRAPHPRVRRLRGTHALRRRRGNRACPQSAGLGALRGACKCLRAGRAAPATLRLAGQAAGLGYLLRHAAHGPGVGRQRGPRRQARITGTL